MQGIVNLSLLFLLAVIVGGGALIAANKSGKRRREMQKMNQSKKKERYIMRGGKYLTYDEAIALLKSTPGFLDSLTPEQRELALNMPEEAECFGNPKHLNKPKE